LTKITVVFLTDEEEEEEELEAEEEEEELEAEEDALGWVVAGTETGGLSCSESGEPSGLRFFRERPSVSCVSFDSSSITSVISMLAIRTASA